MTPTFVFDPSQRFACRDCRARCCRLPVAIPLSNDEIARFESQASWIRERIGSDGLEWVRRGRVPTRDVDRTLQCVFLDEDDLCTLQKKFGHDFLPQTCKSFPFGFVSNEKGQIETQASLLCPSIRDNYGDLVDVQMLRDKLDQKGGSERMSKAMATREGRILSQVQYMRVVERWLARLSHDKPPLEALVELYDWTIAFEDALPGRGEKPSDEGVTEAIATADDTRLHRFQLSTSVPFQARVLHAYILGGLSYPSRVHQPHRLDRRRYLESTRVLWSKLKWLLGRGTVDLLYVAKPVPLHTVESVERFMDSDKAQPVSSLLRTVIERRQIFRDPRHMMEVLMDMALSTIIISRYARCRAASEGRDKVEGVDVSEGISVAELALLGHAAQRGAGVTLKNTRRTLIAARSNFLHVMASEN